MVRISSLPFSLLFVFVTFACVVCLNCSLFFVVVASRLCVHLIQWSKTLPDPDHFKHSVIISIVIHGSALAILNLVTYGLWVAIALCGNVAYQFLYKLTQFPVSLGVVLPAIQKFPVTVGFVLVAMACASCGGIALISAVIIYFILISKMYEDYLEEYVFKTAAMITQKLFGQKSDEISNDSTANQAISVIVPSTSQENQASKAEEVKNEVDDEKEKKLDEKKDEVDSEIKIEKSSEKKDEEEVVEKVRLRKNAKKKRKEDKLIAANVEGDELKRSGSTSKMVKFDLNVKGSDDNTIAVAEPEESFEELYSQLDPEDVAIFSRTEEIEEVDEEKRKEIAAKEAGNKKLSRNQQK